MAFRPPVFLAVVLLSTLMIATVFGGAPLLLPEEPGGFNHVHLPAVYNLHPIPTPTPTPIPPRSDLRISSLVYSGRDEYVEISNYGAGSQDMSGWRIVSVVGDQNYWFPVWHVLGAGLYVRVHSGPDAYNDPPLDLRWTTGYVWNNGGDEAVLYDDKGSVVDRRSY